MKKYGKEIWKGILLPVFLCCLFFFPVQVCAKENHFKKFGNLLVVFEETVGPEFEQFILGDLDLSLQTIKSISIKQETQKLKSIKGTLTTENRYFEIEGTKILPEKIQGKLFKIANVGGKNCLIISKEVTDQYKEIYKNREYYRNLEREINEFIYFINDIENIDEKRMPDIRELFYLYGYSENEKKEMNEGYDVNKIEYYKKDFKKQYKDYHYYMPSLISIKKGEELHETLKDMIVVETVMKHDGKINRGIPIIKDDGKWKLLIIRQGT